MKDKLYKSFTDYFVRSRRLPTCATNTCTPRTIESAISSYWIDITYHEYQSQFHTAKRISITIPRRKSKSFDGRLMESILVTCNYSKERKLVAHIFLLVTCPIYIILTRILFLVG